MSIQEVIASTNGRLICGDPHALSSGVSTDTRSIRSGDLFFALKGENSDGHGFIESALKSGASGIVASEIDAVPAECGEPVIVVDDTLAALGDLAGYYRSKFDAKVIGITGSAGKTMTREMIASILERRFIVLKNEMNFNNEIGVPLTLFKLNRTHQAVVMEMAMRGPGEIRRLAEISWPSIGVITNIGMSHIERLGSREAIASAKSELLEELPPDGIAILNADDECYPVLRGRFAGRIISFGVSEDADVSASDMAADENGFYTFALRMPDCSTMVKLPVMGYHSALNALAASAAAYAMGVGIDDICKGLEGFTLPSMRMEFASTEGGYGVLNDCYNASPASMAAALQTLSSICGYTRKIAALGDMLELGDFAREAHYDIGASLIGTGVDVLVAVGELSRQIAEGARASGFPPDSIYWCIDSGDAASLMDDMVAAGDVILVKGSRGMRMERIARVLLDD